MGNILAASCESIPNQPQVVNSVFDEMRYDCYSLSKSILDFEREITSLEKQLAHLEELLEKAELERNYYRSLVVDFN